MRHASFVFLCLVWGTTWVAIKITLEGMPPFFGAAARFLVAALVLFLFAKAKKISLALDKKYMQIIGISAFLMYVFDYGLVYWGEQYLTAGVTAIFFATFTLFTTVWSNFIFKSEHFRWNTFLGIVIGFIGILIVFYDQLLVTDFSKMVIWGSLAIIVGAAGGAMAVVIIKKYAHDVNPVSITLHQMLYGLVFLVVLGLLVDDVHSIKLSPRIITAIVYLGIFGSALAFSVYYWMLKNMSAITLSTVIYITPIVAIIFDFLILGEKISLQAIIGTAVIFVGIAFSQQHQWKLAKH